MKRLIFLGLGTALMVTMAGVGSAQADSIVPPHNIFKGNVAADGVANYVNPVAGLGATSCAGCHRAHTAKGTGFLTKDPQPLLCLNCHDGTISHLDVKTGTDTNDNGALRGGGFVTAKIGSGAATKTLNPAGGRVISNIPVGVAGQVTSSHQINGTTTGTMWGSNGTTSVGKTGVTLECGACHDPHGNGNYRLLKPNPDGAQYIISGPGVTPVVKSAATTVNIPDQSVAQKAASGYETTDYWNVQAPETPLTADETAANFVKANTVTDGFLGGISAWCTTCHTRYLSPTGGADNNTGDSVFTYKHRSDAQANNKPNCIQCHVAHGTNAVMTGYAAKVTGPDKTVSDPSVGTDGLLSSGYQNSSLLRVDNRGTCIMCHTEGSPVVPKSPVAPK
jgi:predicted CXXCH cytochrome family protein